MRVYNVHISQVNFRYEMQTRLKALLISLFSPNLVKKSQYQTSATSSSKR